LKYRHSDTIDWKKFDQESVLLNLTTGYYFRLNRVGTFIWPFLDGSHNLHQIIEAVTTQFEVSQRQANKDVHSFIEQLLAENLIQKA
jgi:hypothetical protein